MISSKQISKRVTYCLYAIVFSGTVTVLDDLWSGSWISELIQGDNNFSAVVNSGHVFSSFVTVMNIVFPLLLFVSMPLVARWIYVSAKINHLAGVKYLQYSPKQALSWYMVPLAQYVMPYLSMVEIYKASFNSERWRSIQAPIIFPIWWLSFCFWVTLPLILLFVQINKLVQISSLSQLMNYQELAGPDFSNLLSISALVSTVCLSIIVRTIAKNQADKRFTRSYHSS